MTEDKEADPYEKLVELIRERHGYTITDKEAHRLAKNLMGYVDLALKVSTRKN